MTERSDGSTRTVGHRSPDRFHHLLSRAVWNADLVRDDLRGFVVDHLGHDDVVLIVDETGDLKKGTATVGVRRQYTGTAGRIENAQVAVYLMYATPKGAAFIDRSLYLPVSWTQDTARMVRARVPANVAFTTKTQQAADMITRALDAGIKPAWVTGDEVYGRAHHLRDMLEHRQVAYVMAVASTDQFTTGIGTRRAVDLALRPDLTWARISAGEGSRGHRFHDWAIIDTNETTENSAVRALLIRRSTSGELAFYRVWSPGPVTLAQVVRAAGTRWRIEEGFQTAKELTGLDQHQVRTWDSGHRWTILAMAAHALLTVITAHQQPPEKDLIALTRNEIRRLITRIALATVHSIEHTLAWSRWRRHRQHAARTSHYQAQTRTG